MARNYTDTKLQRNYLLSIQKRDKSGFLNIQKPFTLEFDVNRSVFSDSNRGTFRIYNLPKDMRQQIYHDRYRVLEEGYQRIQMFAGYDSAASKSAIFVGNLMSASSRKEGPDWITEVEAFDGFFAMLTGNISLTTGDSWDLPTILRTVAGSMPFSSVGAIGNLSTRQSRPVSMAGNAWEVFNRLSKEANCFLDNEKIYALNDDEYVVHPGQVDIVAGPDNIIGSPRRGEGVLEIEMIFAPEAFVSQRVVLSSLEPVYNGTYVVRGVHHSGTISDAVCGSATTTLTLWAARNLTPVVSK